MAVNYQLLLFSALTILMWGIWGFFGKLALQKQMSPVTIFLAEVTIGALCAIPVLIVLIRKQSILPPHTSWNTFGLVSGAALAIGLLFYYLALDKGQVSLIAPLSATYPIISVLLSYAFLNERPSFSQWMGIALIIVGTMLLLSGSIIRVPQK